MRGVVVLVLGLLSLWSYGQVTELNPEVKWKYVKAQDLDLKEGSVYKYEFAGESGYDYIINFYFNQVALNTYIKIFDFQMKPIAEIEEPSAPQNTSLTFRVPANGTYYVVLGYRSEQAEDAQLTSKFTLIRRPTVY